jgi:hypothetical protein
MLVPYSEEILNTSNTKLAAALMTFRLALTKENPIFCALEYQYKDLKRGAYRRDGKDYPGKDPNPPERFSFNFVRNDTAAAIANAFESHDSQDKFEAFISRELNLPAEQIAKLRDLHSAALAQACREVQEAREYLLDVIKPSMPREAKWGIIRRSETSYALFPITASKETVAKLIRKLDDDDRRDRNGQ